MGAKMVEITLGLEDGVITATATAAKYKKIDEGAAKEAYSTSDKMTELWDSSKGQKVATSNGAPGYGVKGLQIKVRKDGGDDSKGKGGGDDDDDADDDSGNDDDSGKGKVMMITV